MNITLRPETQRILEERLRNSRFNDPDELVIAALNALGDSEPDALDEETLDAIDAAEEHIARGECVDWLDVRDEVRSWFLKR